MMNVQMREVVSFLQSKHISITQQNEWLQGCCSWYSSNNHQVCSFYSNIWSSVRLKTWLFQFQNSWFFQINIQELQNFVYDQWLLADLRDIAENSLPTNISNISKIRLTEKFTLQVKNYFNLYIIRFNSLYFDWLFSR